MSIVPLLRISLVGVLDDKDRVLEAAQAFGALHLIPLAEAQKDLDPVPAGRGREAAEALRWLVDGPAQRRPVTRGDGFDLAGVVEAALANKVRMKACEDRIARLDRRIRDVEPWGEFSFTDLADIGDHRLWFYVVPTERLERIDAAGKVLQIVHRDRYRSYVVLLSPDEPAPDAMPVPRVHVGGRSLSELRRDHEDAAVALEGLELERQRLTKWRFLLARNLAAARDRSARRRAALETADGDRVFVLQAWARADGVAAVEELAAAHGLALVVEPPEADAQPPTLLENTPAMAPGEDLVTFYQTPGYRDWDPSAVVYVSFVIFFGMIMTDAGYGLLLLALLLAFRRRMAQTGKRRRLLRMAIWLALSTTVFGIATGSYFGVAPARGSLPARLAVLDLKDVDTMMRITLSIGVVHIVAANLARAFQAHARAARLQPLGWCLVATGGLCAYLGQGTQAVPSAAAVVALGLLMVALYGSDRPVTSLKSAGLRIFDGAASVARVVNIFSDVLSYMRLFALGLAAASLAETVNSLSAQLTQAMPGVGVLIALAVLALGHGINIGLGLIAGCVHGLRLNVIEFFNWGLSEEGTPFRPFRKEETRL